MTFAEKYAGSSATDIYRQNRHFLSLEMYSKLYDFLLDHGAFTDGTEEMRIPDRVGYEPWKNDIFTAYKSILFGMVVANQYPGPGESTLYLDEDYAIHQIYEQRNLTPPTAEQQKAILNELQQVSEGYAQALTSRAIMKNQERSL